MPKVVVSRNLRGEMVVKIVCLVIVSVAVGCVTFAVMLGVNYDPREVMNRALANLTKEYYAEYLYKNVVGEAEPAAILEEYAEAGLPEVRLRQLLLYRDGVKEKYIGALNNQFIECDTNQTTVRFFPEKPYGPENYRVERSLACEEVEEF